MGLLDFFFGSGEQKAPAQTKPDPEWVKLQQQQRAKEEAIRRDIQAKRLRAEAEEQQRLRSNAALNTRHETALALRRHTSQINLPAIKYAIQHAAPRTIQRFYYRQTNHESLFQFFNKCIFHFFQENGYWPHTIYHPPLRSLPEYDQRLFDFLGDPTIYLYRFMTFHLIEDSRMINQIILEAVV
jgi:hypothetical protein